MTNIVTARGSIAMLFGEDSIYRDLPLVTLDIDKLECRVTGACNMKAVQLDSLDLSDFGTIVDEQIPNIVLMSVDYIAGLSGFDIEEQSVHVNVRVLLAGTVSETADFVLGFCGSCREDEE